MKIAVSYLSSDDYSKCIKKINKSTAEYIHADLCDGKYVDNKNFTLASLKELFSLAEKPLHVHLMCNLELLNPYLKKIDEVLFLTVTPGRGGQLFQEDVLDKVDKFNEIKHDYHLETVIDGGVNDLTISYLIDKDIDTVVSGSFITNSDNYDEKIMILKKGSLI